MRKKINKKGWIRVVEAFVAILLITGALLVVLGKQNILKDDLSEEVYLLELNILREVQSNEEYRSDILEATPLPVEWEEFPNFGLNNLKVMILEHTTDGLDCQAKVCKLDSPCYLETNAKGNVYAQDVSIVANSDKYSPRQLKLFCWAE